jgi:hypothetical protein
MFGGQSGRHAGLLGGCDSKKLRPTRAANHWEEKGLKEKGLKAIPKLPAPDPQFIVGELWKGDMDPPNA